MTRSSRGRLPARDRRAAVEGSGADGSPSFVRRIHGGLELRIKVVPGSSRSALAGILGDRLKVRVAAAAERGRANEAVVRLLCEWLGVSDVEIVSGHAHAEKTVRVRGLEALDERHLDALVRTGRARAHGS